MAGTAEGNRRVAATLKAKYGVDENGKSIFHKRQGAKGGEKSAGYFKKLQEEDPELLAEISQRGVKGQRRRNGE